MTGRSPIVPLPKPLIDQDEARRLNEAFYSSEPHDYFHTRLILLMIVAARPKAIVKALEHGLTYGLVTRGLRKEDRKNVELDDAALSEFVTSDVLNLLHHVAETVIRFYMAHRPHADGSVVPCPWLAMSERSSSREFRQLVRERFDPEKPIEADLHEVITTMYMSKRAGATEEEREHVLASALQVERWLRHFAHYYLDEAPLWNATKHGLAVKPGQPSLEIGPATDSEGVAIGDTPLVSQSGPAVEYLTRDETAETFRRTTTWVQPDIAMVEAQMGAWMIEHMWTVGRARYVEPQDRLTLRFYDETPIEQVTKSHSLKPEESPVAVAKMGFPLAYQWAYDPDLRCTECGRVPEPGEKNPRRTWRGVVETGRPLRVVCNRCVSEVGRRFAATD